MLKFSTLFRRLALTAAVVCGGMPAGAIAPIPGYVKVACGDGNTIEARIEGNADFHYYVTRDGARYVIDAESGKLVRTDRTEVELRNRVAEVTEARIAADEQHRARRQAQRVAPGPIKGNFPTTGTVRGLIVLVEFQDVKFQPGSTQEYFDKKVNTFGYSGPETSGSVVDYFKEQSGGVFTPEFDVVGPLTLPRNRAGYGYVDMGDDVDGFFRDCALAADAAGVDFTRYDVNNDAFVDFFFVIFAGHGEAQGGPAECIWPVMKDESDYILEAFDGMYLGVCACSCELKHGEGTDLDGVGTICHEFSHIIGLPDIYDGTGSGGYGMGHFDMMDRGPYNNDLITPSGYTAMDKYTLGWLTPKVLDAPEKDVTLGSFVKTNDCCFIVNPENPNEYYTIENRQLDGFDSALPGHGLVISYVHYDKSLWKKNVVNSPLMARYEHVTIVPADGKKELELEDTLPHLEEGDTWPGYRGKTEFTAKTEPAAVWRASGSVKPADIAITNIRENEDGSVSFDYNVQASVADIMTDGEGERTYYNLQGVRQEAGNLVPGIYLVRDGNGKTTKALIK